MWGKRSDSGPNRPASPHLALALTTPCTPCNTVITDFPETRKAAGLSNRTMLVWIGIKPQKNSGLDGRCFCDGAAVIHSVALEDLE
jgi:hypothetical protein